MDPRSGRGPAGPANSPVNMALPAEYFTPGSSSFTDFVATTAPHLMPGRLPENMAPGQLPAGFEAIHGTTIVALSFKGGVLIAGDRRATTGNLIASRDMEKVFVTDGYSAVGIAGTAGFAVEMVRMFTVDLEHFEKIEGVPLSLDGKVNKLSGMVRGNLGAAMQGLAVIPLFVGYDIDAPDPARAGRIVSFDVAGSRSDENVGYAGIGSGSLFARSALKKRHDPEADVDGAIRAAVEALYDAADDDTASGLPDLGRQIYPVVATITAEGAVRQPDERIGEVARAVVADRLTRPGG